MSNRVVGTEQALTAIKEMEALVAGPLTVRSRQLRQLIGRLAQPDVWEGPEAARFRAGLGSAAMSGLDRWLRQLEELSASSRRTVAAIMAAGGGSAGGGKVGPLVAGSPADPPPRPYPSDPSRRAAWWQGLSEADREGYLKRYPLDLGYLATDAEIQAATRYQSLADLYMSETNAIAGVDPAHWPVDQGLDASKRDVRNVYEFYKTLWDEDPTEFQWAGLARLAGDEFYGGMVSLDKLARDNDPTNPLAISFRGSTEVYLQSSFLLREFMAGQKRIYLDLAWQHEAYLHGGLPAIQALEQRYPALFDDTSRQAWADIAAGNVSEGNQLLLYREQHTIVQPIYDQIRNNDFLLDGSARTALLSWNEKSPVPEGGGRSFGDWGGPGKDISKFDDRWAYIQQDMWPAYQTVLVTGQANDLINQPLDQRSQQYQIDPWWIGVLGARP